MTSMEGRSILITDTLKADIAITEMDTEAMLKRCMDSKVDTDLKMDTDSKVDTDLKVDTDSKVDTDLKVDMSSKVDMV